MLSSLPEMPVYPLLPVRFTRGEGVTVFDAENRPYLDFYGGHAVASTGHCHPAVVAALCEQAHQLLFYSNVIDWPARRAFCEKLMQLGPAEMRGVFLCNSGAEANENALALARRATGRKKIVAFTGGFHGRTLLTLSLSGLPHYRDLAAPLGEVLAAHIVHVPFNDREAAKRAVDDSCAAVILEVVQGLGGCMVAEPAFLNTLRDLCDRHGAVLIFDEVQCGSGRTGFFTAGQWRGVTPDACTLAKGVASGFPVAAVLANERLVSHVKSGDLGSTFGGGPLACAAGLATLQTMEAEALMANAVTQGERLCKNIATLPGVCEVRGAGLLLGIVFNRNAAEVRDALLLEHRIVTGISAVPNVLRLMPPLTIQTAHVDQFVTALRQVLTKGNE